MDFPVKATVCLDVFQDKSKVLELLRSHDFEVRNLNRYQVRVEGSFLKLGTVKERLEQLLKAESQTGAWLQHSSSGAVPKSHSGSGGHRGRFGSSEGSLPGSPSSPNPAPSAWTSGTSHSHHHPSSSSSPGARQPDLHRQGGESFIVDADVLKYAKKLRQRDIDTILDNHNVKMMVDKVGDSFSVTLQGRSATTAASKLQTLLNDLGTWLRTQEVPRRDLGREGAALLEEICRNGNVYNLVLVCKTEDGLHLIGPSSESYEVKQRLQGRAGRAEQARRRSSSLPPVNRQSSGVDDKGALGFSSSAGAAGYSPSKYQDYTQEGAKPYQVQTGGMSSQSHAQQGATGNKGRAPRMKQRLVTTTNDIKQSFKSLMKK